MQVHMPYMDYLVVCVLHIPLAPHDLVKSVGGMPATLAAHTIIRCTENESKDLKTHKRQHTRTQLYVPAQNSTSWPMQEGYDPLAMALHLHLHFGIQLSPLISHSEDQPCRILQVAYVTQLIQVVSKANAISQATWWDSRALLDLYSGQWQVSEFITFLSSPPSPPNSPAYLLAVSPLSPSPPPAFSPSPTLCSDPLARPATPSEPDPPATPLRDRRWL